MTGHEFRALIKRAGLRQVELARLVEEVSGMAGPDAGTISRYCRAQRHAPASLVGFVVLFMAMPTLYRQTLIEKIKGR